jgi:hypothetical protein
MKTSHNTHLPFHLPLAILTALSTLPQLAITAATDSVPSLKVASFSSSCCICPAKPALKSRSWRRDSSSPFFSWMRACRAEDCEFCEPPRLSPEEGRIVVDRGAKDIVARCEVVVLVVLSHASFVDCLRSRGP